MGKGEASKENWTGLTFANDWVVVKKLNCAEYREVYIQETGDTSKQIKNSHYYCHNNTCGVDTYFERTVLQRMFGQKILSKCKNCDGTQENCKYKVKCRIQNLFKIPDRTPKAQVGETIGTWKLISILSAGSKGVSHQNYGLCECTLCGRKKEIGISQLIEKSAACECFKNHSTGEMLIKNFLDKKGVHYKTEQKFPQLVGVGGGLLRYDFGILSEQGDLLYLIEFDGEQHFDEPGSLYNPDGLVQVHDAMKNEFAKANRIPLLRIPYYELNQMEEKITNFLHL